MKSIKVLALIGIGVAYFVSPLDVIPDIVPPVTWVDDAVVMGVIFKKIAEVMSSDATSGDA